MSTLRIMLFAMVLAVVPMAVGAQEDTHAMSIEGALQKITASQQISQFQDIDCTRVSDDQFEALGDAWMEQMHPGESHEWMDQMMGGEGSTSLEQSHIYMGRNYLGCTTSQTETVYGQGVRVPGMMMGGGMMNTNPSYASGKNIGTFGTHMNSEYYHTTSSAWFWLHGLACLILWLLAVIALIKYIRGGKK